MLIGSRQVPIELGELGWQPIKVGTQHLAGTVFEGELKKRNFRSRRNFGDEHCLLNTILRRVHNRLLEKSLPHIRVVKGSNDVEVWKGVIKVIDYKDAPVGIGVLHVQRFAGFLGPKVSARRLEEVVIEMPHH